jgi:hypothetical protein
VPVLCGYLIFQVTVGSGILEKIENQRGTSSDYSRKLKGLVDFVKKLLNNQQLF